MTDAAGAGVGTLPLTFIPGLARRRGCALVQLAGDRRRAEANRFDGRLELEPSHVGFELRLS